MRPEDSSAVEDVEQAAETPAETLARLLDEERDDLAVEFALSLHPAELADAIAGIDDEVRDLVLTRLPPVAVAGALDYVESHYRDDLLTGLEPREMARILDFVGDDVAADVVQELPTDVAHQVIALLSERSRRAVGRLIGYGEDTAGGRMTGQRVAVQPNRTIGEVIDFLRRLTPDTRQPFYVYVTDRGEHLLGVLNLRTLLTADPSTAIRDVMETDILTVNAADDQEEAARVLKRYRLLALPVVDEDRRLLGTVTADDLLEVLEDEATEDMFRMAGVDEEEDLRSIRRSVGYRLPWLSVNLVTAFIAAFVVARFEVTIAQVATVAAFMPVIAGMGGNAGIQTVTVVVRSLALGRISGRDVWRVAQRELFVGASMGVVLAVAVGVAGFAAEGSMAFAVIVGVSLLVNVVNGMVMGVLLPMLLARFDQDPALSAGIWVTMATDVLGLLTLLGLTTIFIDRVT